MEKLPVKGFPNLFRDAYSNAILNTDVNEYNNYINSKTLKERESKKISDIESDLNSLKNDINEIKDLLRNLVNGSK